MSWGRRNGYAPPVVATLRDRADPPPTRPPTRPRGPADALYPQFSRPVCRHVTQRGSNRRGQSPWRDRWHRQVGRRRSGRAIGPRPGGVIPRRYAPCLVKRILRGRHRAGAGRHAVDPCLAIVVSEDRQRDVAVFAQQMGKQRGAGGHVPRWVGDVGRTQERMEPRDTSERVRFDLHRADSAGAAGRRGADRRIELAPAGLQPGEQEQDPCPSRDQTATVARPAPPNHPQPLDPNSLGGPLC